MKRSEEDREEGQRMCSVGETCNLRLRLKKMWKMGPEFMASEHLFDGQAPRALQTEAKKGGPRFFKHEVHSSS